MKQQVALADWRGSPDRGHQVIEALISVGSVSPPRRIRNVIGPRERDVELLAAQRQRRDRSRSPDRRSRL